MKNCASLKEYSTFQKNDTFARNIENINMNMVLLVIFYIYEGLEPTEDETNTITWFRGRFRPISKFEILWPENFFPEIWIFWWNFKFCPEVLEMFHMVQKTSKVTKVLIFNILCWPQNKNYHPSTHPENHKNRDFFIFLMLPKSSSRMSSCKNSYLKGLSLNSSGKIDVFCTISHPYTTSRSEITSLWKFMIFMFLHIKK